MLTIACSRIEAITLLCCKHVLPIIIKSCSDRRPNSKDATAGVDPAAHEAAARLIWPKIAQEVTTVGAWAATLVK